MYNFKSAIIILLFLTFFCLAGAADAGRGVFPKNPQSPPVDVRQSTAGNINFDAEKAQPAGSVNSPSENFLGQPGTDLNKLSSENTAPPSKRISLNVVLLTTLLIFVSFFAVIFVIRKAKKRANP